MDTAFDNCNNADLNNPVQNLIQNANTEFKTEKSNDIFKTDNPFNDGMNNFVQIGDTNDMHTNLDSPGKMHEHEDLPECEQIYHYGDEILESKGIDKRPFDGDLGPETSVDVPDDVIMATESSEENLSKSSLSHSKEVLPLSDNFNPFDAKNSLTDLETNEFQMQDDTKTCTTPSENLLDTPVDPMSLDDAKQVLPSDSIQTNGIHFEDDRLVEDLIHDQLTTSNEFVKDDKHETSHINDFEIEGKDVDTFINNFVDDNRKKDLDDATQNILELRTEPEEQLIMDHTKSEEQDIIESVDDKNHMEIDTEFEKENAKHFEEEKDVRSPTDETCDTNILDLHASETLLQDIEQEVNSLEQPEYKLNISKGSYEKETLNESDQIPNLDINSSDSTINIEETVNLNKYELMGKLDEISFDEKNSGIDDGNELIPPMQLDSSDSLHGEDEKTHPIEETISIQHVEEQLASKMHLEADIEIQQEQLSNDQQEEISQLQQEIPQLQQDIPQSQEEISQLQQEIPQLQQEIPQLQQEIPQLQQDIPQLQPEIPQLQQEIPQLQQEIPQLQQELPQLQEEIPQMQQEIPQMQQEISQMQQEIPQMQQEIPQVQQEISQLPQDIPQVEENQIAQEIVDKCEHISSTEVEKTEIVVTEKDKVTCPTENIEEEPQFTEPEKLEEICETPVSEMDVKKEAPATEQISQHTALESCEESEDEWNYMRLKGEGEKEVPQLETEELASPAESKSIPEEIHSPEPQGEVESQEAIITTPVEESKDNISTPSVEQPSADTLEISGAQSDLDKEVADMTSQLNPEAKEFIPTNMSPVHFELTNGIPPVAAARHIAADDVVAQSPRKGVYSMEDIEIPSETDFENEIVHCPSEIQNSPEQNELYQEMNLKEAMHECEKEEQVCEEVYDFNIPTDLDNAGMKDSLYIQSAFDKDQDFMNTVQPLPTEIDETKDTSMEIPVVPDTSLNESSVDNISELASLKVETVSQMVEPTPEELINHITKNVDLLELSESPIQPAVESPLGDLEIKAEILPAVETSPDQISKSPISPTIEPETAALVQSITPLPIESEVLIPSIEPTKYTVEPKKEEEKIEKAVMDKIEATKPSIKVPDAKKDVKAKAATASAPKKVSSSTSATSTDVSKPKTSHATSKTKTTITAAAQRPRTAPLASKTLTEKKTTTSNVAAARPKVDARSTASLTAAKKTTTTTTAPKPKPDEQSKVGIKQSISKTGVAAKPSVTSRTSSTTSTTSKTRTPAPTANATTTKTTTSQRVALSATAKSASTTKPVTSPRSTLTSTLRKTEGIKSPTAGTTKVTLTKTTTTSLSTTRTSSTTKQTKPTTTTAKTPTTTTTSSSANVKKSTASPRPAPPSQKRTPIKKTSISPLKKVTDENKKHQELIEVKLNGTASEAAEEKTDSKQ